MRARLEEGGIIGDKCFFAGGFSCCVANSSGISELGFLGAELFLLEFEDGLGVVKRGDEGLEHAYYSI